MDDDIDDNNTIVYALRVEMDSSNDDSWKKIQI